MKKSTVKFRVRYSETDQMGVVYYGAYADYLEKGRTEWLREYGITYKYMEENHVQLPVTDLKITYRYPAKYDDLITVTTQLVRLPTKKIEFNYEIHNEEGKLLARASTELVFINSFSKKVIHAPDYLIEKLKKG